MERFLEEPHPDQRLQVVTVDDHVVGTACFGSCRDVEGMPLGELYTINLDPDHWGHGLGRRLLSEVTDQLVAFGDAGVLWVVPKHQGPWAVRIGGLGRRRWPSPR